MKKISAVLLSVLLIFAFCGCNSSAGGNKNGTSIVEEYIKTADKYIADGDIATAIKVLEEGAEKTKNAQIKDKLNALNEQQKEAEQKAQEEEQKKQEEEKRLAEENFNKLLGTYCSRDTLDYEITLYKSAEGKLKAYVIYGRISGYFDLIDNQNGSYTFVNDGINVLTVNGNKAKINLLLDVLNTYFFDEIPTTVRITPLTDGTELTVSYIFASGESYAQTFPKDNNRSNPDFTEKYY